MRVMDGLILYAAHNPFPTMVTVAYYLLRIGGCVMEPYLSDKVKFITDISRDLVGILAILLILTSTI